jgi:uncharacterized protein YlxW (UPF0749 family)
MYIFLILQCFIQSVYSDIIQTELPNNYVSSDNIIALSLWGMSTCICVKKFINYKKNLPIKLKMTNNFISEEKNSHFKIDIEDKNKDKETQKKEIKKLKKDLNEIRRILIEYEKQL